MWLVEFFFVTNFSDICEGDMNQIWGWLLSRQINFIEMIIFIKMIYFIKVISWVIYLNLIKVVKFTKEINFNKVINLIVLKLLNFTKKKSLHKSDYLHRCNHVQEIDDFFLSKWSIHQGDNFYQCAIFHRIPLQLPPRGVCHCCAVPPCAHCAHSQLDRFVCSIS